MAKKVLLVSGHGYNDVGAVGNGTNERDFIRNNIVDRVAKYVAQGGLKCEVYDKDQDMYQDTAYGQSIGDSKNYGMYWANTQGYDIIVEFHLDSASASAQGGHVIIAQGLAPDYIDEGIASALKKYVDVRGGKGIDSRNDLLHVNLAKSLNLNYRLVELGFITNKGDMDEIKGSIEPFCKAIAEAIVGKKIEMVKAVKKVKTVKSEKAAKYTVVKDDTLYGIAKRHKMTVAELTSMNKMDEKAVIKPGDVLKVKK